MGWASSNLKPNGDGFLDGEGCSWDSVADAIASQVLGFCGCGDPDAALERVRGGLLLVEELQSNKGTDWTAFWKTWEPKKDAFFHNDRGAEYLMWYLFDDKKLTEHGGSVPGWLTQKGQDVLDDLRELKFDA